MILVCNGSAHSNRRTNDFFDMEFHHLPFTNCNPNSEEIPSPPEKLDELISVSEKLAQGFPHVRVDTYIVDDRIYVGEMTFFHNSGLRRFEPDEWDLEIGKWLDLSIGG